MPRPRVTIGGLAIVVALFALDCALLRFAVNVGGGISPVGLRGFLWAALPILNGLAFGLPGLASRRAGPFLAGFEAAGWASVVAYGAAILAFPAAIGAYFNAVFGPTYNALAEHSDFGIPRLSEAYMWVFMIPATSMAVSMPLWCVATLGGLASWAARRRSPRTTPIA